MTVVQLNDAGTAVLTDVGEISFNKAFRLCPVVMYSRNGAMHSVYKRTSPVPAGFNAYRVFTDTWASAHNALGTDFELYDNMGDLQSDADPWTFCNYDDPDVAYPRDCGKHGFVANQWYARAPPPPPAGDVLERPYTAGEGGVPTHHSSSPSNV